MKTVYIICCALFATTGAFAQKAYTPIFYSGKSGQFYFKLEYMDGYVEGSNLEIGIIKSKSKFKTVLENEGLDTVTSFRFNHYSSAGIKFSDYVILENMNINLTHPPDKIYGYYTFKDTRYKFVLQKKKGRLP